VTPPAASLEPSARELLEDAANWRLLGLLFECPDAAWPGQLAALGDEVSDPDLRRAVVDALKHATEGIHHSIFGPGGPAPAREASYYVSVELGSLMSDLSAYYDAFAYRPETLEPPDHVAVEIGFVGYLRLKEAYARSIGDLEHAAITADAARRFMADHLANMAVPLGQALEQSGIDYLALAGGVLARRVGPSTRQVLPMVPEPADDEPFGCEGT
jgi:hypothetical protein